MQKPIVLASCRLLAQLHQCDEETPAPTGLVRPSPAHPAAVDNEHMAADVCAGSTGQVHGRTFKVLGRAPAAGGDAGADAGEALRVAEQGRVHLRLNIAGRDGVDGDALAGPLVGEALGDLADGALGGGVGGDGETALEGEEGGKVDDAAAAARHGGGLETEHVGADVAAERKDGIEVDLDDLEAS